MTISDRAGLTGLPTLSTAYNPNRRFCPTCRASCSVKGIVPIYVRTETPARPIENNNRSSFGRGSNHSLLNEEIEVNHNRQNTNGEDDDEWLALSDDEDNNPTETTGLRYRARFRSTDSEIPEDFHAGGPTVVPRRPRAHSPVAASNTDTTIGGNSTAAVVESSDNAVHSPHASPQRSLQIPLSPNGTPAAAGQHQVSLSNGMFPLVQVAHGEYLRRVYNNHGDLLMPQPPRQDGTDPPIAVPGWDRLQDMHQQNISGDSDSDFLRWLLLLLGSFVMACLLLS
jgi:hypothetical protein